MAIPVGIGQRLPPPGRLQNLVPGRCPHLPVYAAHVDMCRAQERQLCQFLRARFHRGHVNRHPWSSPVDSVRSHLRLRRGQDL